MFSKRLVNIIPKRNFITVVNQAEVAYREFLGRNRVRLESGLRINLPIFHKLYRVSLKESLVQMKQLDGYTKDNVPVTVSGTIFYKVVDAEKVCFSIENPKIAIQNVGESCFRSIIGRFEYDEIISERNKISNEMLSVLGKTTSEWGVDTTRLEIQEFKPQNEFIANQLEKQMQAERARRENELEALAHIRTAEASKQIAILNSEGLLISAKNKSDAHKYELTTSSNGLSEQIESVAKQFDGDTEMASQYLLEMKRMEHLQALATTNNKVYFMPNSGIFPATKIMTDLMREVN